MIHRLIVFVVLAVLVAFFAGRTFAQTRVPPQVGYHAEGERYAATPVPMVQNNRPSVDMLGFLESQSRLYGSLAVRQDEMRNDSSFLAGLGSAEERRQWQFQSDHVMEEVAHLRDDYARLASWVLKRSTQKQALE